MHKAIAVRPQQASGRRILTIRIRLAATTPTTGTVHTTDVLLQAGTIATGWVPHVTEMPWTAGVVGG